MKRKDRETLPSSFSFAAAYLASEFYSAKKPGLPVKTGHLFTESFREQALSSALYAELEERVHSDGEFADLLINNNYAEWKIFSKISFRKQGSISALQTQSLL